ncbi:MAG: hypothetical protein AB7F98_10420 [Novosphingobium sp.]
MARNRKGRWAAGLVITLGLADAAGIYIVKTRLNKPADIGPQQLAVANEPLTKPIAIRANGQLRETQALAVSAIAPHVEKPAAAEVPRTVRLAIPEQARAPVAQQVPARSSMARQAAPVVSGLMSPLLEVHTPGRAARQTAPVVTGALAAATARPVARAAAETPSAAIATGKRTAANDMRVHDQRIPVRATRFERTPARPNAFAEAFSPGEETLGLPDPAFGMEPTPSQATAELPPLELSTSQIHTGRSDAPFVDVPPPAPPATAAGTEDLSPKS